METLVGVLLVIAFIGFIVWRVNKDDNTPTGGGGLGGGSDLESPRGGKTP